MDKITEGRESECLIIRDNVHTKKLALRAETDTIYANIPPGATMKEVKETIGKLRSRLLDSKRRLICPLADLSCRTETEHLELPLVSGKGEKLLAHSELGEMRIICPPAADLTDSNLQDWFRKVIEEISQRNVEVTLFSRLYMLSGWYGLPYKSVQINSSHGR